jgi:tRNA-2-methylthio-N6-dimethylallyladenosine synthase
MDVVSLARFSSAYTFQYSKRPGTPAATMDDQISKEVVQERYERLVKLVNHISWEENLAQVDKSVEILVAHSEGRKDADTNRRSGRTADGRLAHFDLGGLVARPGDFVTGTVLSAAPHHLLGVATSIRATRAGDLSESSSRNEVMLGIPTFVAP